MIFDPEEARRCLDVLGSATCRSPGETCRALRGVVENGRMCRTSLECANGTCFGEPGCAGLCQPFIDTGYSCFDTSPNAPACAPTDFCDSDRRCRRLLDEGDACSDRGCKLGLVCVVPDVASSGGTCLPSPKSGEPCGPGAKTYCGSELFCDAQPGQPMPGTPPLCRTRLPAGAACAPGSCQDGLTCVDGRCVPFADLGAPCVGAPGRGNCPGYTGTCDLVSHTCVIVTGGDGGTALGEPCTEQFNFCQSQPRRKRLLRRRHLSAPGRVGERCVPSAGERPCEVGECDPVSLTCQLQCG